MSRETIPPIANTSTPATSSTIQNLLADERPPFDIRGHHISMFARLLLGGEHYKDLEAPARIASLDATARRREQIAAQNNPSADPTAAYWSDFIGDSAATRQRHQKDSEGILARFIELPADYPVKLGVVQDEICRICVIGDHCTTASTRYSYIGPTRIHRDTRLVDQFIKAACELGLSDQVAVIEEMTDYVDRDPEPVPAALTTADVFKGIAHKSYDHHWDSFIVR